MRNNPINVLIISVAVAVVMLGGASVYSAWVSSENHHAACNRSGHVIDAVENVIAVLLAPQPGRTYTAAQFRQAQAFEAQSSAILDKARC